MDTEHEYSESLQFLEHHEGVSHLVARCVTYRKVDDAYEFWIVEKPGKPELMTVPGGEIVSKEHWPGKKTAGGTQYVGKNLRALLWNKGGIIVNRFRILDDFTFFWPNEERGYALIYMAEFKCHDESVREHLYKNGRWVSVEAAALERFHDNRVLIGIQKTNLYLTGKKSFKELREA